MKRTKPSSYVSIAELRADSYGALRDTMFAGDGHSANVGQRVILPATFTGGSRYTCERQQDTMHDIIC